MIERYSDHAANERTFLAWIRTAIAVMAFGFLVERFDLFLQIAGQTLARHALSPGGQLAGNIAGLSIKRACGHCALRPTIASSAT